jgi:hypothetical protein
VDEIPAQTRDERGLLKQQLYPVRRPVSRAKATIETKNNEKVAHTFEIGNDRADVLCSQVVVSASGTKLFGGKCGKSLLHGTLPGFGDHLHAARLVETADAHADATNG